MTDAIINSDWKCIDLTINEHMQNASGSFTYYSKIAKAYTHKDLCLILISLHVQFIGTQGETGFTISGFPAYKYDIIIPNTPNTPNNLLLSTFMSTNYNTWSTQKLSYQFFYLI